MAALYTVAIAACGLSALIGIAGWIPKDSRSLRRPGEALAITALAFTLAAWIARWYEAAHIPIFGTYESALSLSLTVLVTALLLRRYALWPVTSTVASLILLHGLDFDTTPYALTISERSWVVDVHAVLAWMAFGCLAANAGLAALRVVRRNSPHEDTDRGLSFSLSVGFLLHSAMMVTGSFYKFMLFGSAWSFDPIETLGFVAWIAYATLLHMHLLAGWEGRRLAAWCLPLFLLLVVSYRLIVYFPPSSTYHILDIDLRMHIDPTDAVVP